MSTALALYTIEDELQALTDSLDTCPAELEAELQVRIADYMALERSKVDQVAHFLAAAEAARKARKEEADRLKIEAATIDSAIERLEGYVCRIISAKGVKKLEGRTCILSLRTSDAVVITGELPEKYLRTKVTVEPDKAAIKAALKSGEEVPGADLVYRDNLQRR